MVIDKLDELHSQGEKGMAVLGALLITQYKGVSRIGELCRTTRGNLQELGEDSFRLKVKGKTHRFRGGDNKYFVNTHSKYSAMGRVVNMLKEEDRWYLPVESKDWKDPLFQIDGKELQYYFIRKTLIRVFKTVGIDEKLFMTHSFRSGACTAALARGATIDEVKR